MPMSKYFICCEKCFEEIAKTDTSASKLWMDICNNTIIDKSNVCALKDFPELRRLELMGFIITTDVEDFIEIKLIGLTKTPEGEDFICGKDGKHD